MLITLLSLGSGFCQTIQSVYSKKALLTKHHNDWTVMLARFLYVLPIFIIFWFVVGMPTQIADTWSFVLVIVALVILEVASQWTYHQSIKRSPLSLVMPFQSITPIIILPFAYVLLGTVPSVLAIVGIFISTIGLFLLFLETKGAASVFRFSTLKDLGVWYMIATAIMWAGTTTLQKIGAENAGVSLFGLFYIGGVTCVMIGFHLTRKVPMTALCTKRDGGVLFLIGFWAGLSSLAQYIALTMTNPAVFIALKRTATSLNLLWDKKFFDERIDLWRVAGNILTISGAVLIVLF
jgi:drug/metabolite transporter (DMT)-like permease